MKAPVKVVGKNSPRTRDKKTEIQNDGGGFPTIMQGKTIATTIRCLLSVKQSTYARKG